MSNPHLMPDGDGDVVRCTLMVISDTRSEAAASAWILVLRELGCRFSDEEQKRAHAVVARLYLDQPAPLDYEWDQENKMFAEYFSRFLVEMEGALSEENFGRMCIFLDAVNLNTREAARRAGRLKSERSKAERNPTEAITPAAPKGHGEAKALIVADKVIAALKRRVFDLERGSPRYYSLKLLVGQFRPVEKHVIPHLQPNFEGEVFGRCIAVPDRHAESLGLAWVVAFEEIGCVLDLSKRQAVIEKTKELVAANHVLGEQIQTDDDDGGEYDRLLSAQTNLYFEFIDEMRVTLGADDFERLASFLRQLSLRTAREEGRSVDDQRDSP